MSTVLPVQTGRITSNSYVSLSIAGAVLSSAVWFSWWLGGTNQAVTDRLMAIDKSLNKVVKSVDNNTAVMQSQEGSLRVFNTRLEALTERVKALEKR